MADSGAELRVGPTPGPDAGAGPVRSLVPAVERLSLVLMEWRLARLGVPGLERMLAEVTPERVRREFDSDPQILETALLRTCQRVLLLAVAQGRTAARRWVERWGSRDRREERADAEAIHHLHRIAAGLDSLASGEREIREQVRTAASSVLSRGPRPILRMLLSGAARPCDRADGPEPTSVADLAATWLGARLSGARHRVLVVGAGTVGRRVAERLADIADVTVIYRHRPPDARWVAQWNVRILPTSAMADALGEARAVVTAAKATGRILEVAALPRDPGRGPRWLVDLGVPRNIDPEVGRRPGLELVDLDGLPRGELPAPRLEAIRQAVESAASESTIEFARASVEPWVSELRRRGEEIRRDELARALSHAGPLSDEAVVAVERLTERLVRRVLAGPSEELRALPPGPEADRLRHRVLEILREPDPGS